MLGSAKFLRFGIVTDGSVMSIWTVQRMCLGNGKKIYRCVLILRGCPKARELTEIRLSELGISASPAGDLEDFRIFEISDFHDCLSYN
jgi:hypothetical protein